MTVATATTDQSDREAFTKMVDRLNRLSVEKHSEAYVDVAWDDPELQVDPTDPRWELFTVDPLAETDWYRALDPASRSRLGLHRVAACMKTGWHFENLLQQGLLAHALTLPDRSPEFRYLHHEVIEESQHTLMFQELVNRSGLDVRGMPRWALLLRPLVVRAAITAPALFFVMVLGGEDPIDHVQRIEVRNGGGHPLAREIMRIHVAEEARHLSFARHQLKVRVPRLGRLRRELLSYAAPVILGIMVDLMLGIQADVRRANAVPAEAVRQARRSSAGRELRVESVRKARELLDELGLLTWRSRLVWRAFGLIPR